MNYTDYILQAGYTFGYLIIFAIIFAESGLFFGFFLPGDSFLLALGILASKDLLSLPLILIISFVAAVLGDSVGYASGKKFGPSLFNRPDSRFFKKENIEKAQAFYELHGKKTIILARFTPFVRTFAPIVAGMANMHYPTFLFYNVIGGALWVSSMTLLGYFLGSSIGNVDHYTLPVIAVIIVLSLVPTALHILKERSKSK
jgi:membrane-associated protein